MMTEIIHIVKKEVDIWSLAGMGVWGKGTAFELKWTPGLIQTEGGRFTVR
jgi:hypothetical protein